MKNTAQAVVFTRPGEITVQEVELGPCGASDIVVRTLYTMVSAGTELRVLDGHYGAADKFPLVPGYSVVGEVTSVGSEAKGFRVGDLISGRNPKALAGGVTCYWGGQAGRHVYATTGEDRPVLLPPGAKPLDYVIAEISAISLRGVDAAAPRAGETAVVIGQGLIGAFSGAWLHSRGCRVIVTDIENSRLERALKWGAAATVNGRDADVEDRLKTLLNGGADIVVESSGTPMGAMLAYKLVRKKPQAYGADYKVEPISIYRGDWPRLIMQANYLEPVTINPFRFTPGEGVTILSPSDRGVEDRQNAIEAIRRGDISTAHFIGEPVPVADAPAAYHALRTDKNRNFSLVLDWTR